ncbi:MAG: hypothetical protein LUQ65_15255 [Candidatus Helarchaeota archaeon]|nr:hypothetical protein [Candidatus Helarchaeota archaeon]
MPTETPPPPDLQNSEKFPFLQEALGALPVFFEEVDIKYETKITSLSPPPEHLHTKIAQIQAYLRDILSTAKKIAQEPVFTQYREFGSIIEDTLAILSSLQELISTNIAKFHHESHRLLKYYWGIRFFIVRSELEANPEYCANQVPLFNLSDALFEFMEVLQAGPQPIEILREVDLEVRLDGRLSFLLSRSPDAIDLSPLGKQLLKVHSISEFYYYYLYEFEEDVL